MASEWHPYPALRFADPKTGKAAYGKHVFREEKNSKMRRLLHCGLVAFFCFSCAKIPVQSVMLVEALQEEGARMHQLNLHLLNQLFQAKRADVEKFINNEYTPSVISKFIAKVEKTMPETDFKKDFAELMQAIAPEISSRRDSMINVLESQKEKLVEKLNADYSVYNNAASDLRHLLQSATKVDKEKQALFGQIKTLSNNRLDFNSVETELDKFINASGNVSNNVPTLNEAINRLVNNK